MAPDAKKSKKPRGPLVTLHTFFSFFDKKLFGKRDVSNIFFACVCSVVFSDISPQELLNDELKSVFFSVLFRYKLDSINPS